MICVFVSCALGVCFTLSVCLRHVCVCVCVSPYVERQCAEAVKRDFGEVCVGSACVCYAMSSECVSSRAQKPFRGTSA